MLRASSPDVLTVAVGLRVTVGGHSVPLLSDT